MKYREAIRSEFQKKKFRNADYSIQDFARDLEITAIQLRHVFRGKRKLPKVTAFKVAKSLGLYGGAARRFSFLISP